ncbi:MAG: chemotaxis protein CheW [Thermodesulfobacteriota bacterium]
MDNEPISKIPDKEDQLHFTSFYLHDTLCGIDISRIQEVNTDLAITKVPLAPEYVIGIKNLRGQIVTIIDQSLKIGYGPSKIKKSSRIIIINSEDEYIGLLADKINDIVTAPKSAISEPPSNIKGVQGKFFTGVLRNKDKELMAILNLDEVLAI